MLTILAGLYAISPLTKEMYRGGFDRNFETDKILKEAIFIELPYNSYYVAGTSTNNVYFGNWTNHFHMITMNMTTLDTQHINLKIKGLAELKDEDKFKLKVDSPYFYLFNGTTPQIFRGQINEREAYPIMKNRTHFSDAEPISKSSFILRSYSLKSESYELGKTSNDTTKFRYNYDILEKQTDGIFCVQGTLNYDKELNNVVYTYTYRNQYIVLDTNLNLKYRANTIDTFSRAPIKVVEIESKNNKMLTGIPAYVNPQTSISGKFLFIRSAILSKNEDALSFLEGSTFDIYNILDKKYVSSINIHNLKNKPISEFKTTKNKLIILTDKSVLIYTMDLNTLH
jgi:hypothetical protein